MTSAASVALSARLDRASAFAAVRASGNATAAVTATEIRAARQVAMIARPVRVRANGDRRASAILGVGGITDTADGPDDRAGVAEFAPQLRHVDVDRTSAGVSRVAPD